LVIHLLKNLSSAPDAFRQIASSAIGILQSQSIIAIRARVMLGREVFVLRMKSAIAQQFAILHTLKGVRASRRASMDAK
jgi:hypothetical protein